MIGRLTMTASAIATATGGDLELTAQKIADGVTRGFDNCDALDRDLNFLTADQRQQIEREFEAGKAEEARLRCLNALETRATAAVSP